MDNAGTSPDIFFSQRRIPFLVEIRVIVYDFNENGTLGSQSRQQFEQVLKYWESKTNNFILFKQDNRNACTGNQLEFLSIFNNFFYNHHSTTICSDYNLASLLCSGTRSGLNQKFEPWCLDQQVGYSLIMGCPVSCRTKTHFWSMYRKKF